jgi:HlyD family secretion protein
MGRFKLRTSGRSLVLTALVALCVLEAVMLLEISRDRHRAGALGATSLGPIDTTRPPVGTLSPIATERPDAGPESAAGPSRSTAGAEATDGPRRGGAIRCMGVIESRREDLTIGTLVAGVVAEVYVERGDVVKKGDPLFRLDDRDFRTQLAIATANLAAAEAQVDRMAAAPQQGDLTASEAAVEEARAHLNDAELTYRRSQTLFERKVESAQDRDRDRYAYIASKATLARLEAERNRLKATWEKDRLTARAAVSQARAQVEGIQVNVGRVLVRAAAPGRVLHVRVRPGQFAGAAWNEPLVTLGDSRELLVRADVDEADLPAFAPRSRAVAILKGRPDVTLPLTFFDTEPSVISRPGRAPSGPGPAARDRRVLQVLYELPRDLPMALYVGQELEVSIDPAPPPTPTRVAPVDGPSTAGYRGDEPPAAAEAPQSATASAPPSDRP